MKSASNHQEFNEKLGGLLWPKGGAPLIHQMSRQGLDSCSDSEGLWLRSTKYCLLALHRHIALPHGSQPL